MKQGVIGNTDEPMKPKRNSLDSAVQEISRLLELKPCVLVSIDGHGGSGKSTVAEILATKFDGQVVHNDDFYRVMDPGDRTELDVISGVHKYFDWQRLKREVLDPVKNGKSGTYQKYDWVENELGSETTVQPSGVVIVEGVYSFRSELSEFYDLGILIECPREMRMERLSLRGDEEMWTKKWDDSELWYFENEFRKEEISVIIQGY